VPGDFLRQVAIDAVLELREITERAVSDLLTLAPFGTGNPPPLLAGAMWKWRSARGLDGKASEGDGAPEWPRGSG